jgi:hypothetical protein
MISNSFFAPITPAPDKNSLPDEPGDDSALSASPGNNFSSYISQSYPERNDSFNPSQNPPPNSPGANDPNSPDAASAQANAAADDSSSESPSTNKSDAKITSSDASREQTGTEMDPVVSSMMMALLLQPHLPPPDAQKLVPMKSGGGKAAEKISTDAGVPASVEVKGSESTAPEKSSGATALTPSTTVVEPKPEMPGLAPAVQVSAEKNSPEPAKIPPADNSQLAKGVPVVPAQSAVAPPPLVVGQVSSIQLQGANAIAAADGTTAALNRQRMKFSTEKNEIAGRAVQKLPGANSTVSVDQDSAASAAGVEVQADGNPVAVGAELSGRGKDSFDATPTMDFSVKATAFSVEQGGGTDNAQPVNNSAAQVERVAHLVNQEAIAVRQSGASSLSVSLKLDSQTELSLQLTHHDGQIQASIRVERGDGSGLGGHWGDLQESLARQNIQLAPLDNSSASRNAAFNPATLNSNNFSSSNGNPQNSRFQQRDLTPEAPVASANANVTAVKQPKTKKSSPQGWESWA